MFKNQKGITLVALVITIIVLLILAGVSISLVVGNGGILGKATNAVDRNEQATVEQEIKLSVADAQMAYYTEWTSNQSTAKALYFADLDYYTKNCTSGTVDFDTGSVTKAANPDANTGTVKIKYTTKSNVVYKASIDLADPTKITISK